MKSKILSMRRPLIFLMLVVVIVIGGLLGLSNVWAGTLPRPSAPKINVYLDYLNTNARRLKDILVGHLESYFQKHEEQTQEEPRKVVVTSPEVKDVTLTQQYVCQIRSKRHIDIRALDDGYLEKILVREGQAVKEGDKMFQIKPILYKARLDAEMAEFRLAELEYLNTERLFREKGVVSQNEVLLFKAKMDRAKAKADLAQAEFNFTDVTAPFEGIVDRLHEREGSLIKERDILTTLSDNSVMWVYFNVPEAQYLEYMASLKHENEDHKIELVLANHNKFPYSGEIGAIEAKFNNETGNIAFRADFPNPDRLLRHGQTGTILIHRNVHNAIVVPQRATFEILDKRYVWVVGEDDVVHQTLITIKNELEDVFVLNSGLDVNDKFVLEGVREVQEGGKVEYEFRKPEEALENMKFHAE